MKKLILFLFFTPLSIFAQSNDSIKDSTRSMEYNVPNLNEFKDIEGKEVIYIHEVIEAFESIYVVPKTDANGITFESGIFKYFKYSKEQIDGKIVFKFTNTDNVPHLFINTLFGQKY